MKPPPLTALGAVAAVCLFGGSIGGGLLAVQGVARGQVDAGLAPVVVRVEALEASVVITAAKLDRLGESSARQETKLDLVLERWRIPNPAPAPFPPTSRPDAGP